MFNIQLTMIFKLKPVPENMGSHDSWRVILSIILLVFSTSLVLAVSEGGSCGYLPDGGPFCDEDLACNYFQCVYTGNPSCSSMGGDYCYGSLVCIGGHYENSAEGGWCCIGGDCRDDDYNPGTCGRDGDMCYTSSDCCGGYTCDLFRCTWRDPENPSSALTCASKGGVICYTASQYCTGLPVDSAEHSDSQHCCTNGYCDYKSSEGESCSGWDQCLDGLICHDGSCTANRCVSMAEGRIWCDGDEPYYYVCEKSGFMGLFGEVVHVRYDCKGDYTCSDGLEACVEGDGVIKDVFNDIGKVFGTASSELSQGYLSGFFSDLGLNVRSVVFVVISIVVLLLFGRFLLPVMGLIFAPLKGLFSFLSVLLGGFFKFLSRPVRKVVSYD